MPIVQVNRNTLHLDQLAQKKRNSYDYRYLQDLPEEVDEGNIKFFILEKNENKSTPLNPNNDNSSQEKSLNDNMPQSSRSQKEDPPNPDKASEKPENQGETLFSEWNMEF